MTKRLSIDTLAAFYSNDEADLLDRNALLDEEHCRACGSLLPDQAEELFPLACPVCGHQEADELG